MGHLYTVLLDSLREICSGPILLTSTTIWEAAMTFLEEDREARTHARGLRAICGTFLAALLFWVLIGTTAHFWNHPGSTKLEQATAILKN